MNLNKQLENEKIKTSVPCRVDLGGTLDISTFYLPLNPFSPSCFNIALDMRTNVTLSAFENGKIKISSKGFESAQFDAGHAPYNHPMGLMFAVADYFNASGVHIHIESSSPPRGALGGSSSAAVAIVAAFLKAQGKPVDPLESAWLAHYIESSVAGVPCGMQDQLAAAVGGVNQWFWEIKKGVPSFKQKKIYGTERQLDDFNKNILVAYCGIPHVSKDINQRWVNAFKKGETRILFQRIARITNDFSKAVKENKFFLAKDLMIEETKIRCQMTPDVLDNIGKKLFERAMDFDCGARFTGAGGGGCIWAISDTANIKELRPQWQRILGQVPDAKILDTKIDHKGLKNY
ncbi:MAG: galactokinase [Desulfobacteraceae bacterium]|nr:galactokinase [Desulfobacteraceae bacterium]